MIEKEKKSYRYGLGYPMSIASYDLNGLHLRFRLYRTTVTAIFNVTAIQAAWMRPLKNCKT